MFEDAEGSVEERSCRRRSAGKELLDGVGRRYTIRVGKVPSPYCFGKGRGKSLKPTEYLDSDTLNT